MTRFAALLPALCLAAPVMAQDKESLCATSAEIVDSAVEARQDGMRQKKAIRTIGEGLEGDAAIYKPAVEPIVNWVYTLEEDQLTDEVAATYEEACLAQ
ncbi:DNA primase [uncultured Roseovarius sp.]|uniref:DNA primase n=1 Tax=uncultured Roseovarius sp. TaxID=293344 RepID=UPI0025DCED11|nr:DNA primase [uncultured Roseovarius sp.]